MPSASFRVWQNDRMARLSLVDTQCAASFAAVPPTNLADENLRGYVMLLSAHFQGFCRDLYSECIQLVAAAAPAGMKLMIQRQGEARHQLGKGNPSFENIREDFERFGFDLNDALMVPDAKKTVNEPRVTHIGLLNKWRNYAAHHSTSPPSGAGPFDLATVQSWKNSCDGLAAELDGIMYNQLQAIIGAPPW